jgi:hypothetical protein
MLPQPLPCPLYSDKVLHLEPNSWTKCNTLSGGNYVRQGKAEPAHSLSFSRTILLDDRTPCRRDEVFDSFGSSLSRRGRILQQLHPQRQLIYASFYPTLRRGRTVVLPRYRLLAVRESHQDINRSCRAEPGGHDRGNTGRKTSGKVPFRLGSAVPQRQNPASEDGTIPCLFLHLSPPR